MRVGAVLLLTGLLLPGFAAASRAVPAADPRASRHLSGLVLEERRGRVVVSQVVPGSPAAAAGLLEGDVLLTVDDLMLVDLDPPTTGAVWRKLDSLRQPSVRLVVGRGSGTLGAVLPVGPSPAPKAAAGSLEIGMMAPEFTAQALGGAAVTLAGLRGRPVLIDFWASWCPPCRDAAIVLRRLGDQFGKRLAIVGVSLDEDRQAFEAFAYNHHLPGYQVADGSPFGPISVLYGAPKAGLPFSVLVSPEGKVVALGRSLADKEEAIAALVGPASDGR